MARTGTFRSPARLITVAVSVDSLSPAARAEATALGLKNPFRDLPSELGFTAWFEVVEENFRAIGVAADRAVFNRYRGHDVGDLDRFRECHAVYCFDEMIERHCRANLDDLSGLMHRRVELFLEQQLQFKIAGDPATAECQAPIETRFFKFRGDVNGQPHTFGQLNQMIKRSAIRAERQAAWEAFIPLGRENSDEIFQLVATRNRLAQNLGYRDFIDLRWRHSGIDEAWMLGLLDQIERETQVPYEAACQELSTLLGVDRLEPWDLAFAVDLVSPLPPDTFDEEGATRRLEKLLVGWGFSPSDMGIPVYQCESFTMGGLCFGIEPGKDVAILLSPTAGPRYYRTFFHEYGHAMHFRHAGQNNVLLNVEDMAFNEGMAVFFESFVSDEEWVSRNFELNARDLALYCRQARFAALAWMRTLLINVRFEHALYTQSDLSPEALYLELQQACGGFELSLEAGARWAADQMLVSLPVNWHNYVTAELIARQTRETLLARDGSLLDNPGIREFLMSRYYLPGATIPWPEKIVAATGKMLDGDAFFRYLRQ